MKKLLLLICLLFPSFSNAGVYARYDNYFSDSAILLTDWYYLCYTYEKPLMVVSIDSTDGTVLRYGCYGLSGNDVIITWSDSLEWGASYPASAFTLL